MTLQCQDARPLVPAYLDGEVSEAQAGPLRKHLLACHECRSSVQNQRALKRWFEPQSVSRRERVEVPPGFAARVARRAFAGDTGDLLTPVRAPERGDTLQFVLQITSIAAAIMLIFALALRSERVPSGGDLRANDSVEVPKEQVLEKLEELNEAEGETRRGE